LRNAPGHSLAIRLNPANPDHHLSNTFPDSSGTQSAHVRETWRNHSLLTKQQAASYFGGRALHAAGLTTAAILTKQQAAEYLQTTPRYIERMVASGRLRALKPTGKLWRVRQSDLDAFLESGATIGGVV
jgi:excisionase family DNA binding protein